MYLALRDPRTPWHAKALGAMVVAYAFSPIDVIPDFIPVLGYVDNMILLPLGVWLTMRLIPPEVMAENRRRAQAELQSGRPRSWAGAVIIVLIWIGAIGLTAWAVQALGRLK